MYTPFSSLPHLPLNVIKKTPSRERRREGNFLPPPLPSVPGAQNRSTLVKRRGKRGHKTQQFFPSCHGSLDRGEGRKEGAKGALPRSLLSGQDGGRQEPPSPPPLTIGIATHFARQLFVSVFLRGRSVPTIFCSSLHNKVWEGSDSPRLS